MVRVSRLSLIEYSKKFENRPILRAGNSKIAIQTKQGLFGSLAV